jgi:EAL domain-containing protein (putative c-di-GMP-specific phosphodiesterase class I)
VVKKSPVSPKWIALITGLVVLLISFFGLGSLERSLAHRELALQADMILRGFQEAYQNARVDLTNMPPLDQLNCQNEFSEELARRNFDDPYVRWFGVARGSTVLCRGPRVGMDLSSARYHHIDDEWSIVSVRSPANVDNLLVSQSRGDLLYLAMIEPLLFDFMHEVNCKGCISYEFFVKAEPRVDMVSPPASRPSVISYSREESRLGAQMRFTLNATQEYVDKFSFPGRLLSAAIGSILGLVIGLAVHWYLTRQMSTAFLIEKGLKRNEFLPYYQPIVDSRTGSVLGAEALARWQMKGQKLIPPLQFIPFAEENNLIEPITDQLKEKVLEDIKRFGWHDTGQFVSINAVAGQITDSPFCAKLIQELAEKNIPAKNISVEITERHQFPDLDRGRTALQSLVDAGVRIDLDDAGTGYGGFSYIQELPITTLKIDKMFIDTLREDRTDPKRAVLYAIIEFAKTANLHIIAEGVETAEQAGDLGLAGVFAIQGFVYSRPMPAEEFMRWMNGR